MESLASTTTTTTATTEERVVEVTELAAAKPVVIFGKTSCPMNHSMTTLFISLGANTMVHEVDQMPRGREIQRALLGLGCSPAVPAVFVAGNLLGGASDVMRLHLTNSLIPLLQRAGAL